ncbi:1-phosphofructokinase [Haloplasma contractile]|uniref:Fructose-1-phosphate kinase protein n=1 Tax=Haloplasma contractile SSD-17B TaxID=1033810 RepID=U2EGW3_9MOLU|nr:1-phosphofructokinase [Haloplasma contractile]ERJ13846.1 Fructose-1-phosphate kinase protein [Haloplasma contractile SSD-17B]
MIYTCTLNPSVDYKLKLDDLVPGTLNRVKNEEYSPGGKGINVSIVLNNLGIKSTLFGYVAGFTGSYIKEQLNIYKYLKPDFVEVSGQTRINVKLKGQTETEINASGPHINEDNYLALLKKIKKLKSRDILVIAGSVPSSIKHNVYNEIARIVDEKGAFLVVDATKQLLRSTLEFKPFLIKPNKVELEELFDVKLETDNEVIKYAKKLQNLGAKNVLISLGGDGAVLITQDFVYRSNTIQSEVIHTVGAGDSMVAGFLADYIKNHSFESALRFATACGSATAFSKGLATKDEVEKLISQIKINIVKEN